MKVTERQTETYEAMAIGELSYLPKNYIQTKFTPGQRLGLAQQDMPQSIYNYMSFNMVHSGPQINTKNKNSHTNSFRVINV